MPRHSSIEGLGAISRTVLASIHVANESILVTKPRFHISWLKAGRRYGSVVVQKQGGVDEKRD